MSFNDIFISEYYYVPFFIICIILFCIACCIVQYFVTKYKNKKKLPKYKNLTDFLHYHKNIKDSSHKIFPLPYSNECFMCFHTHQSDRIIILECKHALHSQCIINWWRRQPSAFASCPLCRHVSNICLLEVKLTNPNEFVGFYRNDNITKTYIRLNYTESTDFIIIKDKAKQHALDTAIYIYHQASLFSRSILFTQ
jgi:hypothetical protein